jgi:small subunit ribosomal protein S14
MNMAKKSAIEKNEKRKKLVQRYAAKRDRLRTIARDRSLPPEERFQAYLKLAEMPRNGAAVRVRSRCMVSGRPRGNYRKFKISRIALRDLASIGQIPGMVKSSW